ncbi:MAG TPA: MFS transporter [Candidatus Eisenbergiella merdigallinarum]|uniref:MFS transporter n=1 Tax=Candidatus Eisenbergiella merdigallinarum TaxID=2838552 RepID=A0A9D2SDV5_9FIRM|nr:MFS transporter [Candidatus Eisenbergiella merdigallinarum]
MKRKAVFFSFLLFLYYCRYCILYSFASVFFDEQGYSAVRIGQLAAASGLVVIFAGPIAGMLADRIGSEKKVILSCLLLTFILTAEVYAVRKEFYALLLSYGAVSFFDKAISPLLDSWIVRSGGKDNALPYGRIRAAGSLGGALSAAGTGALIDAAGFGMVFFLHMGMTALLFLGALYAGKRWDVSGGKAGDGNLSDGKSGREKAPCDAAQMARPLSYAALLAVVVFLFTGVTAEITYYPILFQKCGGSKAGLGLAMFLMSASELTGMALYPSLRRRVPLRWALFLSLIVYTIKLGIQVFAFRIPVLMLLQLLQGGAYGILLPAVTEMVPLLAGRRRTAAALSACHAGMQGVGTVLGNWAAGMICGAFGLRQAFAAGTCFCGLAAALYFIVFFTPQKRSPRL